MRPNVVEQFERTPPGVVARSPGSPRRTRRDLDEFLIDNLAYDVVVADERIASLETDVAVLRVVLNAAIDALRTVTLAQDRGRATLVEVEDAYRRLREHCLLADGADEHAS